MKYLAIVCIFLALTVCGCKKCCAWHYEHHHTDAWTETIPSHHRIITIEHPAIDYDEAVCDKYCEDK
jgi:hypothetical protein